MKVGGGWGWVGRAAWMGWVGGLEGDCRCKNVVLQSLTESK